MSKDLDIYYELCEMYERELERQMRQAREKSNLSGEDAKDMACLVKTIKNADTIIAMREAKEEEERGGYSRRGMSRHGGWSYDDGGASYDGGSYARGYSERRGQNRDSMGRYSRDEGPHEGMSHDYLDAGLSEIVNIARGKMVGLPPEEKRRRVQMITEELSK